METSAPNQFIKKAAECVMVRLTSSNFSIHELSANLYLSREHTHRKIKEYTGLSAGKFIRYLRLIQAVALLKEGKESISEIAYKVGFESPSYFTKCFKEELKCSPLEIKTGNSTIIDAQDLLRFYTLPEIQETLRNRNVILEIPSRPIHREKAKNDRWIYLIFAIMIILFSVWIILMKFSGQSKSKVYLEENGRIAIIPFLNHTGSPEWDLVGEIAGNWIAGQFSEMEDIKTVPYFTVKQYQSYLGILPDDPENRPTFREIVGAQYFLTGSYFLNSNHLNFDIQLSDAFTQEIIYDLPTIAGPPDSVMLLIEEVRLRMAGLISSLESVRQGKIRPPKYQAYQYYLHGLSELRVGLFPSRALEFFEKASQQEPDFVMAQIFLTWFYQGHKRDSVLQVIGENPLLTGYENKVYLELYHTYHRNYHDALKVALKAVQEYPSDYYFNMEAAHLALALYMPHLSLQILSQLYDPLDSEAGMLWHHFKIFNFTQSLMMLEKKEEALNYLRGIPTEFQSPAIPTLQLRLYARMGWNCIDVQRAIDDMAGQEPDRKAELLILAATEYRLEGQKECSMKLVKEALRLIRNDTILPAGRYFEYDLADALFVAEDYLSLKEYLEYSLHEKPDSTDLIIYLVQTEAALGNLSDALHLLSKVEDQPLIYWRRHPYEYQQDYLRARLYALAGKRNEANVCLARAMEKGQLRHHIDFENDLFLLNLFEDSTFLDLVRIREDPSLMPVYLSEVGQ